MIALALCIKIGYTFSTKRKWDTLKMKWKHQYQFLITVTRILLICLLLRKWLRKNWKMRIVCDVSRWTDRTLLILFAHQQVTFSQLSVRRSLACSRCFTPMNTISQTDRLMCATFRVFHTQKKERNERNEEICDSWFVRFGFLYFAVRLVRPYQWLVCICAAHRIQCSWPLMPLCA